jgi:hypothetical protein
MIFLLINSNNNLRFLKVYILSKYSDKILLDWFITIKPIEWLRVYYSKFNHKIIIRLIILKNLFKKSFSVINFIFLPFNLLW